ncbi:MAG: hypothetical protein V7752_02400 [Halopseudomonas sp.]
MMELLTLLLISALAAGCGYLGGRWYAAYKQAKLQARLESDTANFLAMLEERNQDYVNQKQQIDKARVQSNDTQLELNRALVNIEQEQETNSQLQLQIDEFNEKQLRMRERYSEMETERALYRDAKLTLEAEAKKSQERDRDLSTRNERLEERFNSTLIDKTRLQTDMVAKERELQDLRKRLIKQEDLNESAELTLAQMRSKREEMTQQLAHAEGQLSVITKLKQTLKAPQQQAEQQQSQQQLKQDFIELTDKLSG